MVDGGLVLLAVPDERGRGCEVLAAQIVCDAEIIMVHAVGGGTENSGTRAGNGIEIPATRRANRARIPGRRMRGAARNTGGNNVAMLATGELLVGIENIQDARAVTCVERRRKIICPTGGLDGAIQ